jgi:hypothetical protein
MTTEKTALAEKLLLWLERHAPNEDEAVAALCMALAALAGDEDGMDLVVQKIRHAIATDRSQP